MGEICCSQCKNCLEEENKNQIITQCDEPKKNFRKSKLKNDSIKQSKIIDNDNENFNTNYQNIENENQKNGKSLTSVVNVYNIRPNSSDIPNIRIVDTPGLGDTRGLDFYPEIINI